MTPDRRERLEKLIRYLSDEFTDDEYPPDGADFREWADDIRALLEERKPCQNLVHNPGPCAIINVRYCPDCGASV